MNTAIFILALIGLSISYKILYNKKHEIHVCPIGTSCKEVLTSQHNKFLGIPNEINGMIYYGIIAVMYGLTLFDLEPAPSLKTFLLIITALAFLFSIYLTFIQGVQLKKWCMWCVSSAIASTSIFALVLLYTIPQIDTVTDFLITQRGPMFAIYSLGLALGLGAATTSYLLFYRFLRDFVISKKEKEVFHYITQIVWTGLAMMTITATGLFLTQSITSVSTFQMIVIIVLLISEAMITLFITPHMSKISVKRKTISDKLCSWRRIAFAIGGMSIASWYLSFSLGYTYISFELSEYIFLYIGLLILAVMASQILEIRVLGKYLIAQKKK